MNLGIDGRVAFVSGGSRGIGFEVAKQLAGWGARVVIAARQEEALASATKAISAEGGDVRYVIGDMTQKADIDRAVGVALDTFGQLDIAVSNVYPMRGNTFGNLSDDDFRADFEALIMSVVHLTRAVIPSMKERRFGRLVNIGSIVMKGPFRGLPHLPSNVFRPGVAGLNKSLAYELAPFGITVNNIATGFIRTSRQMDRYQTGDLSWDQIEAARVEKLQIPMGRLGAAEEVGALAAFLSSEGASYITGQTIAVDGGFMDGLY
jgi:3-oxoacyl-[acyl-carrier protein] reductase